MIHEVVEKVLVSEEEIMNACRDLGERITKDYTDKDPLIVGLLKGCVPFMSDLSKFINLPIQQAYMVASSYHGTTTRHNEVQIKYDLEVPVSGRHVLIVEDIVDSGRTIKTVIELLKARGAASVEVATLLDKPEGRVEEFVPKYIGVTIPNEFVIGYGLDWDERYRNLRYVGVLKKELYD